MWNLFLSRFSKAWVVVPVTNLDLCDEAFVSVISKMTRQDRIFKAGSNSGAVSHRQLRQLRTIPWVHDNGPSGLLHVRTARWWSGPQLGSGEGRGG
ncbi:hypothetical protein MGG_17225 [Pyricularia oryzae 70-15]|uniref:Uncharacterized protein n=3 Tax=Pyricularia oryzae TaxID=318829 RepID=G4N8Z5_PYRO7|nr:uncharacterized protein MGG_17225 [Pyricularia oryzae 70-15]EHA51090.1 hypothetical protein MGG_17225 [Pyricularia oryzae 70-15]ELQ33430.1 hypothetical protein OOU_Y34scaffold00946g24 [Pyricularia oryzae Y34]KAI7914551.1 hypothetical protein M0657_009412 [Pyricularia oryzae]KAI7917309.1 hypothetical protein M9X92_007471 [Pyricularia oryzae]